MVLYLNRFTIFVFCVYIFLCSQMFLQPINSSHWISYIFIVCTKIYAYIPISIDATWYQFRHQIPNLFAEKHSLILNGLSHIDPGLMISSWWRHQMETFSALLDICAGNSPVPGEFSAQRPVTRIFDVFLICVWINGWVNNRAAGDLRRYRAHYDVTVMMNERLYWFMTRLSIKPIKKHGEANYKHISLCI